jgi:branched-subunit amino acid ABC-type transport system permease component
MGFSFVFKASPSSSSADGKVGEAAGTDGPLAMGASVIVGFLPLFMVAALVFGSMIAMLLLRPQGLFGRGVRV